MKDGLATIPYSREALESLAATLKIHRSLVWLDPVSNRISVKQFEFQKEEINSAE